MLFVKEGDDSTFACKASAGMPRNMISHSRLDFIEIHGFRHETAIHTDIDSRHLSLRVRKEDRKKYLGKYYLVFIPLQRGIDVLFAFKDLKPDAESIEAGFLLEIANSISTYIRRAYFEVEQHRLNREREDNIRELKAADKEREEFMNEMAHALKAPMQSILSETEYLAYRFRRIQGRDQEIVRSANKVIEEVGILKNKLDNSLLSGDMEIEYNLKHGSLTSLIEKCANQFRSISQRERNIDIIVELDSIPKFQFDWYGIDIVFTNLLDNAVKYSHGGKDIYVRGTLEENGVRVEIEDFGLGIMEEEKRKIFRKYHRAELRDRRRFIPGTGIGLTVAKKIVEDHGGRIEVDSYPSGREGHDPEKLRAGESFITTFAVYLPIRG